jgi:hypothetical protein
MRGSSGRFVWRPDSTSRRRRVDGGPRSLPDRTLAPFFERLPAAFAGRMRIMADNYRQSAADAGRPVDDDLLGPILAALEHLDEDQ